MKYLLSLCSLISMSTAYFMPATFNTSNALVKDKINSRSKVYNENDLPVPNVGNWDLTTGQGFYSYLGYVYNYVHGGYRSCVDIYTHNDGSSDYYDNNWDDSAMTFVGNKGYISENVVNTNKSLLDASKDILTNNTSDTQTIYSSGYSHSETKGHTVTTTVKISDDITVDAIFATTKLTMEFDDTDEYSDVKTDTFTAPSQPVVVPPHSQVEVDYSFYKSVDTTVDTAVYRQADLSKHIGIMQLINRDGGSDHFAGDPDAPLSFWFSYIQNNNLDWLFHIDNAYVRLSDDGVFWEKATTAKYTGLGTEYHATINDPIPL